MTCTATGARLTEEQKAAVRRVAELAAPRWPRSTAIGQRQTEILPDGGEAYAYPHPGGGIAWGYNDGETGFCVARGICRRDR